MVVRNGQELVGFFHKHVVPLCCVFSTADKRVCYVVTAFVLSVEDEWFLVTAGHVAKDLLSYRESPGYHLQSAFLSDSGGLEAVHCEPIPFDLSLDRLVIFGDENSYDYSIIHLPNYYRRLLEQNHVQPLDEQDWLHQPQHPDFHMLLGIPRQLISVGYDDSNTFISTIKTVSTMHQVKHVQERPPGLGETQYPRWYGYINLAPPVDDISGVSGAPIFAFKHLKDEQLRYWLVGVQSTWNPGTKAIAACPADLLGSYVAHLVKEYKAAQE